MDLVSRAIVTATQAHAGQVRKYTGEPYIVHPLEVMTIVRRAVGVTPEMLAASVLHDVLEDTPTSYGDLASRFGLVTAQLVYELTEPAVPGNRSFRKETERWRLSKVSPVAKTIKLADLISNTQSITHHDPKFAEVYLAEKGALLNVLQDGDAGLFAIALRMVPDRFLRAV
jgi:(p)ppGpp synthase/HD superfamily hydrolase